MRERLVAGGQGRAGQGGSEVEKLIDSSRLGPVGNACHAGRRRARIGVALTAWIQIVKSSPSGDLLEEPVLAYRTTDPVEARALGAQFEDAEIPTQFVGDYRDTAYPGLGLGSIPYKELWVSRKNQAAADAIVERWVGEHHANKESSTANAGWMLGMVIVGIVLIELVLGLLGQGPWGGTIAIAFNFFVGFGFFYFALRRLKQKRAASQSDEPFATI